MLAAMLLSVPLAAQTPESRKVYPAASTVNLAEFAVTFQVPQGWTAAAQDQPGALLLANADRSVIGFLFLKSGASESEIKGFLSERRRLLRIDKNQPGLVHRWCVRCRCEQGVELGVRRPSAVRDGGSRNRHVVDLRFCSPADADPSPLGGGIRGIGRIPGLLIGDWRDQFSGR